MAELSEDKSWMRRLAFVMAAFLLLAGFGLGRRWTGSDEGFAGSQYHAIARHQLLLPGLRGSLAQFRVFHDIDKNEVYDAEGKFRGEHLRHVYGDCFWVSRLPFGALLHTASLAVFGDREWAVRLVPLVAVMGLLAGVFFLFKKRFGSDAAFYCACACALCPGVVIYSHLPGYEMPCLAASAVALILYDRFRSNDDGFGAFFLCALLAGLLGWFGLFVPVIVLADNFIFKRESLRRAQCAALLLVPVVMVALYAVYLSLLGQSLLERLAYFWNVRSLGSGGVSNPEYFSSSLVKDFTIFEYLDTIQKYMFNHVTVVPLVLCLVWVVKSVRAYEKGETLSESRLVWMFAAFGAMCYASAFRSSFVHRYYVIWWLPFICVSGGFVVAKLRGAKKTKLVALAILFALFASSAYKVKRSHEKAARELPIIGAMEKVRGVIPSDEAVAVIGMDKEREADSKNLVVNKAIEYNYGRPQYFYLWRRLNSGISLSVSGERVLQPESGNYYVIVDDAVSTCETSNAFSGIYTFGPVVILKTRVFEAESKINNSSQADNK